MGTPDLSPGGDLREQRRDAMLTGSVESTLIGLALPMLVGIVAVMAFNLVDTYFVGQLGALELAAMSYTFPVVFVVMSISMGLSLATTALVSRAIGLGDRGQVRRLTTHALVLANLLVVVVAGIGLLTIEPLFRLLGAGENVLPLIREYMFPWYLGVGFLVIPMVGNGGIRATGDTRTPSLIMIFAGSVNALLDPPLIFGWGPLPAMGLQGAAIATIIGRGLTFLAAIFLLHRRERMLELLLPRWQTLLHSWRLLLRIGVPTTASRMLVPLASGVLTRMVSDFGDEAVAGFGIGQRLEPIALVGVSALGSASIPFIGQNHGANALQRVRAALRFGFRVALVWGGFAAASLALFAVSLASFFNDDPRVLGTAEWFFYLVPWSYGLFGLGQLSIDGFNALNRPRAAAVLVAVRLFVLALPLAWWGRHVLGVRGIFGGMALANALFGAGAALFMWRFLRRQA